MKIDSASFLSHWQTFFKLHLAFNETISFSFFSLEILSNWKGIKTTTRDEMM